MIARVLFVILIALFSGRAAAQVECTGKIIELDELCWSCIFPIGVFNIPIFTEGQEDWDTGAEALCSCTYGPYTIPGINISFWEPIRLVETVRHPGCFPMLDGQQMDLGRHAPPHGQLKRNSDYGQTTGHSFYQVHWYTNPVLYIIQSLVHFPCLDTATGLDLAYMTEYDPLWDDSEDTFILNPDAALFTSVLASVACAVDCVWATFDFALPFLFWCAGCQGRMYPLVGWVAGHIGGIQASSLIVQRFTNKLHRQGLMRAAWGVPGQCGQYPMPIMDKRAYKKQMVWPFRTTNKFDGKCCNPYGRTTQIWQAGKTVVGREDYGWQVFQRKDCCYPARF